MVPSPGSISKVSHKCVLRKSNLMCGNGTSGSCYIFSPVCGCVLFWAATGICAAAAVSKCLCCCCRRSSPQRRSSAKGKSLRSVIFNNKWERIVASSAAAVAQAHYMIFSTNDFFISRPRLLLSIFCRVLTRVHYLCARAIFCWRN